MDVTIPQHFSGYVFIFNILKEGKQKHIRLMLRNCYIRSRVRDWSILKQFLEMLFFIDSIILINEINCKINIIVISYSSCPLYSFGRKCLVLSIQNRDLQRPMWQIANSLRQQSSWNLQPFKDGGGAYKEF